MSRTPWPAPAFLANGPDGRTIGPELCRWLQAVALRPECAVVTLTSGFVSVHGLLALVEPLSALINAKVPVRILFGVTPFGSAAITWDGSPRTDRLQALLADEDHALNAEIEGIPVNDATRRTLVALLACLRDPLVQVRRYERGFFHAKAVIVEAPRHRTEAVVGSFNLTRAGLTSNIELALSADANQAAEAAAHVNHRWKAATPYALADLIGERLSLLPVELVYLRMLAARYAEENPAPSRLGLTWFQELGVAKATAILRKKGGVLIADEVGLGKTYIAGELIDREDRSENARVLVLCPAHLKRAVWRKKLREWGQKPHLMSYHQFLRSVDDIIDEQSTGPDSWPQYSMIVCDEAHYLRNPRGKTRKALERLISYQRKRPKMVLLTATPVNNRGTDLYELLMLASPAPDIPRPSARHWDPWPGLPISSRELRTLCQQVLIIAEPELRQLRAAVNELTVRRSRHYVQEVSPNPSGRPDFPVVEQVPIRYQLDQPAVALFADLIDACMPTWQADHEVIAEALASLRGPEARCGILTLATYAPELFATDGSEPPPWVEMLLPLLRSTLLKRIESSLTAFAQTARRMADQTHSALEALAQGHVRIPLSPARQQSLRNLAIQWLASSPENDDEQPWTDDHDDLARFIEEVLGDRVEPGPRGGLPKAAYRSPDRFDVPALRCALEADYAILDDLAKRAEERAKQDPKAAAFLRLMDVLSETEGKAIVFSSARTTSADLGERINHHLRNAPRCRFRSRFVNLGTWDPSGKKTVARALAHFSPSTAADLPIHLGDHRPEDAYDLLLCTDALSEGVNLQEACIVVNYDLPWNPMRLVQRIGRVDRIGSLHTAVTCYTFLPDQVLDVWLHLMDILRRKTATAARLVGVASTIFPDSPVAIVDFATLVGTIEKPEGTPTPHIPLDELHRAWLQRARTVPEIRERLTNLSGWAGAVTQDRGDDPFVLFCFQLLTSGGNPGPIAFCRIYGGRRRGATCHDARRCLEELNVDPTDWIDDPATAAVSVDALDLDLVYDLLEDARREVAEIHEIPQSDTTERVRSIAWILRPAHR